MLPLSLISRKFALITSYIWAKYSILIIKLLLRIDYQIEGQNNIPTSNCIIASNHQSAWETIFYLYYFKDPIFILKKELFLLPVVGFYCYRTGMIFIDRRKPLESIKKLKKAFVKSANRKIIIFPEGTRTKHNQRVKFKSGIYLLASSLKIPTIPTAHNAGKFWPKGFYDKNSGTINLVFTPQINDYADKKYFIKDLENKIYSSIK